MAATVTRRRRPFSYLGRGPRVFSAASSFVLGSAQQRKHASAIFRLLFIFALSIIPHLLIPEEEDRKPPFFTRQNEFFVLQRTSRPRSHARSLSGRQHRVRLALLHFLRFVFGDDKRIFKEVLLFASYRFSRLLCSAFPFCGFFGTISAVVAAFACSRTAAHQQRCLSALVRRASPTLQTHVIWADVCVFVRLFSARPRLCARARVRHIICPHLKSTQLSRQQKGPRPFAVVPVPAGLSRQTGPLIEVFAFYHSFLFLVHYLGVFPHLSTSATGATQPRPAFTFSRICSSDDHQPCRAVRNGAKFKMTALAHAPARNSPLQGHRQQQREPWLFASTVFCRWVRQTHPVPSRSFAFACILSSAAASCCFSVGCGSWLITIGVETAINQPL